MADLRPEARPSQSPGCKCPEPRGRKASAPLSNLALGRSGFRTGHRASRPVIELPRWTSDAGRGRREAPKGYDSQPAIDDLGRRLPSAAAGGRFLAVLCSIWPASLKMWAPEGSLAGFFVRRGLALELVCGPDFSWKLTCGAGPGDLGGGPGGRLRPKIQEKTDPKISSQTAFRYPAPSRCGCSKMCGSTAIAEHHRSGAGIALPGRSSTLRAGPRAVAPDMYTGREAEGEWA